MEFIQAGMSITFSEKNILIFPDLPLYHGYIAYTLNGLASAGKNVLVKALILLFN